jgi:uncharacterized protein (DUF302 family)
MKRFVSVLALALAAIVVLSTPPASAQSSGAASAGAKPPVQIWDRWTEADGDLTAALTWQIKVKDGVSTDQVEGALSSVAIEKNLKAVGEQALSKELESRTGKKQPFLKIYSYCSPVVAREMVDFNPVMAAFLPCRIALVEKADGLWLYTFNMDVVLKLGRKMPPDLLKQAMQVRNTIREMLERGAKGEF